MLTCANAAVSIKWSKKYHYLKFPIHLPVLKELMHRKSSDYLFESRNYSFKFYIGILLLENWVHALEVLLFKTAMAGTSS